jgi:hypothetical protein
MDRVDSTDIQAAGLYTHAAQFTNEGGTRHCIQNTNHLQPSQLTHPPHVRLSEASAGILPVLGGVGLLVVVQDGELDVFERAHNVLEKHPRAYRAALVAYVLLPVGMDLDKVRELLLPLLGHTIAQLVVRDLLGVVVAPAVNLVDPPQLEVVERLALEAVLNSSSTATLTRLVLVTGVVLAALSRAEYSSLYAFDVQRLPCGFPAGSRADHAKQRSPLTAVLRLGGLGLSPRRIVALAFRRGAALAGHRPRAGVSRRAAGRRGHGGWKYPQGSVKCSRGSVHPWCAYGYPAPN